MKILFAVLFVILAVIASGCTAVTPSSATPAASATTVPAAFSPTPAAAPALAGTWAGTMAGYEERTGFTDYGNASITMVVSEQNGRIFTGYFIFGSNSTNRMPMAGVASRDGRTFSLVENENGYTTGEIFADGTMELIHIDDADPYGAALDTLRKV